MLAAWTSMDASPIKVPVPNIRPPPGLESVVPTPPGLEAFLQEVSWADSDAVSTHIGTDIASSDSPSGGLMGSPRDSMYLLQDLHNFREVLMCRLLSAHNAIGEADEDLSEAVRHVLPWIEELHGHAQTVATQLFAIGDIEVLASCSTLLGGAVDDQVSLALASLGGLRKQVKEVRSEYLRILERLRYLSRCTVAVWADSLDASQSDEHAAGLLELGLGHLRALVDLMEECTDFWMMLHDAELKIGDLKAQ